MHAWHFNNILQRHSWKTCGVHAVCNFFENYLNVFLNIFLKFLTKDYFSLKISSILRTYHFYTVVKFQNNVSNNILFQIKIFLHVCFKTRKKTLKY